MRCLRCGAGIDPLEERCSHCGEMTATVVSAPPLVPGADGIPIARYSLGTDGTLVGPEPYLAGELMDESLAEPARRLRMHVMLPRAPRRRRKRAYTSLLFLLALLVIGGVAGGMLVRSSTVDDWLAGIGQRPPEPTATVLPPTPTPRPPCEVQPIDPAAARIVTQAQMTTGLRNPSAQDYRPIDKTTTFQVGQRAYITFVIATTMAGTAEIRFCTPGGTIPGMLAVPAGVSGRYGQFSVEVLPEEAGSAVATLLWNGTVAASIPFTVTTT